MVFQVVYILGWFYVPEAGEVHKTYTPLLYTILFHNLDHQELIVLWENKIQDLYASAILHKIKTRQIGLVGLPLALWL